MSIFIFSYIFTIVIKSSCKNNAPFNAPIDVPTIAFILIPISHNAFQAPT